jgi:hypothetical protein
VTTALVDEAVWADVRRRRGPSTWVVVVAIVVGIALVWGAFWARGTGRTMPQLTTDGMSAKYDETTRSIDLRVRLGNTGAVPVTVVGARFLAPDGSDSPVVTSVTVTPTVVPAGAELSQGAAPSLEVPIHIEVECAALDPNAPGLGPEMVLTTTGTWPQHDWTGFGADSIPGLCDPALRESIPSDGS